MKTKSIRAKIEDAEKIEDATRILAVELRRNVKISEIVEELTKNINEAMENIKKKEEK
jgi:hypothetical protein